MTFKEKDIRDPEILKRYFELVEKDSATILASDNSMVRIDQKKWGLGESVVEFEKSGYTYEKCIESRNFRPIAMQVLAAGALRPDEAFEYVCKQKNIESILFGSSTKY